MYSFIRNNFTNSSLFLSTALKAGTLSIALSSKKVLFMDGFCEIMGIDLNTIKKSFPDNYHIEDLIPQNYIQLKQSKLAEYYALSKGNLSKDFMITYALNKSKKNNFNAPSLLVNIIISRELDTATICLCSTEAISLINDKVMLISNSNGNGAHHVVYATPIHKDDGIPLINYEYDVLYLLAKGYDSETISNILCISKHTADDYRKTLLEKFKAQNSLQLIYHAYKEGYI